MTLPHLLLFDIDGTLVDTGGVGLAALQKAFVELYPEPVAAIGGAPELDLAGATDSGIAADLFGRIGMENTAGERERFYRSYLVELRESFGAAGTKGRRLEGVVALLEKLGGRDDIEMGLLTGNIAEGARVKVDYYGIGEHFVWGAYGDDHHDRNALGPIAIERAAKHLGRDLAGARVTVIGDTPKDIRCARAVGARVVAVATGKFGEAELAEHEPDVLLADFSDLDAALAAVLG